MQNAANMKSRQRKTNEGKYWPARLKKKRSTPPQLTKNLRRNRVRMEKR